MAKKATRTAKKASSAAKKATTRTATKAAKRTGKRELINTGSDARYAKRQATGRFAEMDDVGRAQRVDKSKAAKTIVASGFGDQGDRRPAKRPAKKR
jgi:hypothetical protein